jgi:DNA mismatch repair protein MutL
VARQALLIPEIVTLGADADRLLDMADDLAALGLVIEPFGPGTPRRPRNARPSSAR